MTNTDRYSLPLQRTTKDLNHDWEQRGRVVSAPACGLVGPKFKSRCGDRDKNSSIDFGLRSWKIVNLYEFIHGCSDFHGLSRTFGGLITLHSATEEEWTTKTRRAEPFSQAETMDLWEHITSHSNY